MRILSHTGSIVHLATCHAPARPAHSRPSEAPGLHLIGDLYGCRSDTRLMTDAA
jgi:hypothetical protein